MKLRLHSRPGKMLLVLHPVFALTGAVDVITGPLLPSLARTFHLSDGQSGVLFFRVFAGTAVGALLCRGNYTRVLTLGLMALACSCAYVALIARPLLYPWAFCFGCAVGAAMTAISLFAGRNYPAQRAATLTKLNFTWSVGALVAPLLASRLLAVSSWRAAYLALAGASLAAGIAVSVTLRDSDEAPRETPETSGLRNLQLVALFAIFFFLEVGMESTFGAWISTYVLRATHATVTLAAAATAIYWAGFLAARGLSPLLLLRMRPARLLQYTLSVALGAAALLILRGSPLLLGAAIFLLGAALAPVFPIALAGFFDRARHSSDTRFILALSGFGGSIFPEIAGAISSHTGSLRIGLMTGPVTLLVMIAMLPLLEVRQSRN
jgi:fucose permease